MIQPVKSGSELLREIDQTISVTPTLWWLGHAGFVVRFANITFYIDPCLTDPLDRQRRIASPLLPEEIRHADMIFVTHAHPGHLDAPAVKTILELSKTSKVVLPKAAVEPAHAAGIPYNRMTTTDSGLRIEYFKDNLYGRVYAVPSAHPDLDYTQADGFPYLGYLIRFGRWTVYHAGDCAPYPGLVNKLRPYSPNVVIVPIGPGKFAVSEAADLAAAVGGDWLIPMHHATFEDDRESEFVAHMLGHRPLQRFRALRVAEKWTVPEE